MSKYGMGLLRSARLTRRQLITFALVSAVLNGVVTACVGTWLAQTYATQQSRRKSVETLAHLIYDRRTRAGMVVSSLRRNAPPEEIQYRKRAYDEAYVDWNKNILLNLFAIREVAGDLKFTTLVKAFEDELVASMADVDRCLTKAPTTQNSQARTRPRCSTPAAWRRCISSCSTAARPSPTSSTS
jgi:hypothetical protein